jgi:ornithine carbamoyltransferase
MRHLISLKEQSEKDLLDILNLAQKIKKSQHEYSDILKNKTLIMLFQKTSTRTRLSFEAGMTQLGGHAIFLDARTTQVSLSDFKDEIQAIMRFGDLLMFRALKADDVNTAASFNKIPVIDACSEKYHPAQALTDILTMTEYSKGLNNIRKVAWLGVENNVSNTLKIALAKLGVKISLICPEVDATSIDEELNSISNKTGNVSYTTDLKKGLEGADYVHTDTWVNMEFFENGKVKPEYEKEYKRKLKTFMPYQLNLNLVKKYAPEARIMHCMPCHVGYEITRDAIDSKNSIIYDQAENRLHAQKAILLWLLGSNSA